MIKKITEKNRKGQFYLIAAAIIVVIIIGLAGVTNYVMDKNEPKIYNLKDELGIEGKQVIQYGVYTSNSEEIDGLIEDFTRLYSTYSEEEGRTLYFIFGDEDSIKVATYGEIVAGNVGITIGGTTQTIPIPTKDYKITEYLIGNDKEITIKVGNNDYTVNLKRGQNFYFVISQYLEGETHVVQG